MNQQEPVVTNANNGNSRDERSRKRFERKLTLAHEPDSIFIMPVGGRLGIGLVISLTSLDRAVNILKRQMIFKVKEEDGVNIFDRLQDMSDTLWKMIRENVPSLHSFTAAKWRELNDSKDKKLLLANRKSSMVILPRDEKIAQIAAAIKVLNEKIFDYQVNSQFEELGKLVDKYRDVDAAITDMTKKIETLVDSPFTRKKGPLVEEAAAQTAKN